MSHVGSSDRPIDAIDLGLRHGSTEVPGPLPTAESAGLGALAEIEEQVSRKHASLWGDAWRRLVRNRLAIIGLCIVTLFVLIAIFAPLLAPYGESEVINPALARHHPSWVWPMGLDRNGRD